MAPFWPRWLLTLFLWEIFLILYYLETVNKIDSDKIHGELGDPPGKFYTIEQKIMLPHVFTLIKPQTVLARQNRVKQTNIFLKIFFLV